MLFHDAASGLIRHGAPQEVPPNLAFLATSGWRSLAVGRDGVWSPLTVLPRPGAAATPFELVRRDAAVFVLRAGANFLCAEPGGATILVPLASDAAAAAVLPMTFADHAFVGHVLGNDWRSATAPSVIRSAAIHPLPGFAVRIGPIDVALTDLIAARGDGFEPRRAVTVTFDGWKLDRLDLYRPLVFFTAFGDPAIFACLDLALRALVEIGHYRGQIMVMTEKSPEEVAALIGFRSPQLRLIRHPAADRLDIALARYAILDAVPAESFQPILYLDTDVLCGAPLDAVLGAILSAGALCLASEHDLLGPNDWYGASLFREDATAHPCVPFGVNTGILGIPNADAARPVFAAIRRHAPAIAAMKGSRDWADCYDQPVANYVLHKGFAFDTQALAGRVRYSLGEHEIDTRESSNEFVHFNGGFGNAGSKTVRMRRFLDRLRG